MAVVLVVVGVGLGSCPSSFVLGLVLVCYLLLPLAIPLGSGSRLRFMAGGLATAALWPRPRRRALGGKARLGGVEPPNPKLCQMQFLGRASAAGAGCQHQFWRRWRPGACGKKALYSGNLLCVAGTCSGAHWRATGN